MNFFETSFLWLEAVIASVAAASVCALVGVYTILRRVVFLPATLSQISSLGVAAAFLLIPLLSFPNGIGSIGPEIISLVITLAGAFVLGWMPEARHLSREAIIGVAYIVASAGVILIGDRISEGTHDIHNILFGNAVMVERSQMLTIVAVAIGILIVHALMLRPFLHVSLDPETAKAHGVPVKSVDALLFLTLALAISTGTKTLGAMPIFAFTVLPAAASLKLFESTRVIFIAAFLIGAASAFLGYWGSFSFSLPTGASMAVTAGLFFVLSFGINALRERC